jgi:tRNA(Ile)-lysidine synthetase-like protein
MPVSIAAVASTSPEPAPTTMRADSSGPSATTWTGRVALAVGPEHYPLVLRSRVPGDRVVTAAGTRKLKKLFGERRVPVGDRGRLPVLADRTGRVIWVSGLVVAEWARPAPGRADLMIEIENA